MATYVLVHGGRHGGWCYTLVAQRLRARGHAFASIDPLQQGMYVENGVSLVMKPGRAMDLLMQRSEGRVWDIDTGHDLMLTEPDWVAEKLLLLA